MKSDNIGIRLLPNGWQEALYAARFTQKGMAAEYPEKVSDKFKRESVFAEHSHIKLVRYAISIAKLRQWVGVHLLRHPFMLPFICSQRVDRMSEDEMKAKVGIIRDAVTRELTELQQISTYGDRLGVRDCLPQGCGNDHLFYINVQTLINISRKRLCSAASVETRMAWLAIKTAMQEVDPVVASAMVPNCIYRGACFERHADPLHPCRYSHSKDYAERLAEYRKNATN